MPKSGIFAVALFILLAPAVSQAARVINTQADFEVFVSKALGVSRDEQFKAWDQFETKYQSIYDNVVFSKGTEHWEERRRANLEKFFTHLPQLISPMRDLFENADRIVKLQESRFKKQFTDLGNDTVVYFLPSALTFNGKASEMPGAPKSTLFIGVDSVADRNDDLGVLFSHEFFHVYHFGKLPEGSLGKTMATPLWTEGFATFVSGVLNPGHSDAELLMDNELGSWCSSSEKVSVAARAYLEVMDTDGTRPGSGYSDWFLMKTTKKPSRQGYCLGLKVVQELARTHELSEMSSWNEEVVSRLEKEILTRLASGG